MELRQVEYFLAVVEHGGIRRAATALRIAQPSVSQGIRALERELGTELFHRVGRRMVLSPAGTAFVRPARQLRRDASTVHSAVAGALGLEGGRLDIASEPALSVDPTARLVGLFRSEHPEVSVRLVAPLREAALTRLVRDGTCELGFGYLPQPMQGLSYQVVGTHEIVLVLPPGSPGAGSPASFAELDGQPMIVVPRGAAQRDFLGPLIDAAGVRTRIAVQIAHREAILPMVLSGVGATLLPLPRAEEAARRGAVIRRVTPPVTREVALFHRVGELSHAAQVFWDLAGESAEVGAGDRT
ncbi:LysR family transcriptional regulator [Amycolatopsis dendrobii]|uniref:LysR family transcriptional regulator n=1 Tax=Amycolatopsis dendrobii TaxID=2760662 RepID=A0A7W3W3F7_9PSEU|nr:LysR family transcriptional regulator [Amycolatopsis dendrobii]MBB1158151.1 LysR family transcriptional regulator [Amycolatopsis dendrobii]